MTRTLVLGVVAALALLALAVALADRFVAVRAGRRAAAFLSEPLGRESLVRFHGTPFLSQAFAGRYRDVEVTASGLQVGTLAGVALRARLVGVRLPLAALLGGRTDELPVEHVHAELVIPFRELARISRVPGLRFSFDRGRMIATAALPVPGISVLAKLSGEAVATVTDSGLVWLRVRNVAVAGITVPGIVLNQLVAAMAFPVPLPPLPYGLRLDRLTPSADGLVASGSAREVVFGRPADLVD